MLSQNNLYSSAFFAANTNNKYQEPEESEEMQSSYRASESAMLLGLRNYENDVRSHSYSQTDLGGDKSAKGISIDLDDSD